MGAQESDVDKLQVNSSRDYILLSTQLKLCFKLFQGVLRVADSVLATIYLMTLYTICHASEREDKSHPTHINPSFSWEGVIVPHPLRGGLTRDSGQISVTSRCISAFCESFERVSIQRYVLHDSKMMKLYIYKVVLGRNSWGLEVSSEILCSRSRGEEVNFSTDLTRSTSTPETFDATRPAIMGLNGTFPRLSSLK